MYTLIFHWPHGLALAISNAKGSFFTTQRNMEIKEDYLRRMILECNQIILEFQGRIRAYNIVLNELKKETKDANGVQADEQARPNT